MSDSSVRRLLMLTHPFPPDNTAAARRPAQLFDYLPRYGYRPIVVASSDEGAESDGEFILRVPGRAESATTRLASKLMHGFQRFGAPYYDRLAWVPYAVAASMRVIKSHPVDAIYSTSPYIASHVAAYVLKGKFDLPWIADFQDPLLGNPYRTRNWYYPYDAILERAIFRRADRLMANTDTVEAVWKQRYPQWSQKMGIFWNSFDPKETIAHGAGAIRSQPVLAHIGVLYGGRGPGVFLAALERLGAACPPIRVKLIGPIHAEIFNRQGELIERMRARGILQADNVLVSRKEAVAELAEADYLLLLDLNDSNASLQVPSKLFDYVRSGKPILAYTSRNSPVERILMQSGIDYAAIAPDAPSEEADRSLLEFFKGPREIREASAWFNETFDATKQAGSFARLLDGLLRRAPVSSASARVN